jgi:hypothetical protein
MDGVALDVEHSQVWWSALSDGGDFTYTQRWSGKTWTLTSEKGNFTAQVNDRTVFSCTAGVRVVTDLDGKVLKVVGIDSVPQPITLSVSDTMDKLTVNSNQVFGADGKLLTSAPFDYPYRAP